jgi:hypothetical protein
MARTSGGMSGALGTLAPIGPHNGPPAALAVFDPNKEGVLGLHPRRQRRGAVLGQRRHGGQPERAFVFRRSGLARRKWNRGVPASLVSPVLGGDAARPFPNNPGGWRQPAGPNSLVGGGEAAGDIFKSPLLDLFGKIRHRGAGSRQAEVERAFHRREPIGPASAESARQPARGQ